MKKTKQSDLMGPLSDEEMNHYVSRLMIAARMNNRTVGEPPVPYEERLVREVLHYRACKKAIVTVDEQFTSMGIQKVCRYEDLQGAPLHSLYAALPLKELGFDMSRGQRFLITVAQMAPNKKMKPLKDPAIRKYKPKKGVPSETATRKRVLDMALAEEAAVKVKPVNFCLNEQHTTHITKSQARKERENYRLANAANAAARAARRAKK